MKRKTKSQEYNQSPPASPNETTPAAKNNNTNSIENNNTHEFQNTPEPYLLQQQQQNSEENPKSSKVDSILSASGKSHLPTQPQPLPIQELLSEDRVVRANQGGPSDPNEDWCRFCKATGELVCCELCPSAWHTYCLTPPLKEVPTGVWICPLCDVNRASVKPIVLTKMALYTVKEKPKRGRKKKNEVKEKEKLVNTSSPWWDCLAMVNILKKHKHAWPFSEPVNPEKLNIPDYHSYVSLPMDFSTVERKLHDQSYRNMNDFANDIRLIWSNAETYNGPDNLVTTMAYQLREIFEDVFVSREKFWKEYFVKIPFTKRRLKPRPDTFSSVFHNTSIKKSGRKTSNSTKSASATNIMQQTSQKSSPGLHRSTGSIPPAYSIASYPNTPNSVQIMTYEIPVATPPRSTGQRQRTPTGESPIHRSNLTGSNNSTPMKFSSSKVSPGIRVSGSLPHYQSSGSRNTDLYMDGKSQMPVLPPQRQVQYIRIYYGKTIIKSGRNSLESLRRRLSECFNLNNNFRLYYLDQDETTRIEVFDEKCFNIFLQSNVKKNLYMEKTKD